ncbi:MAG: glycosyltransferase family 4 protein, partial [Planctomycetaceae bacterium]|nr:glycosyltransferase family 4 protein [Planctomycetaceae bacterium]
MSSERLRIVHTESSCGWGGQEVRILTESCGMLERGHDVQLICCPESIIAQRAQDYGVPVTTLPIRRRNFQGAAAARWWLAKNRADVINTHSSSDSWLFTLAGRSLLNRPRIVRTRHIGAPVKSNPASNWIYSQGADFVVTCGNNMRQTLIANNGVQADRSVSVPTGIDLSRFQPSDSRQARQQLNLPQDKLIVGIVAALRREKGHQYLCEALRQVGREDVHLLIVGDGLSHDLVRNWVAENGLSEQTTLAGNQQDVVPYLNAMDLFVLPSWGIEGVPQSIMQAMSCRLPVIATDVGSVGQTVDVGQTGILVPPRDSEQLAAA